MIKFSLPADICKTKYAWLNGYSAWQILKLSLTASHCKLNLPGYSVWSACQTVFQMMSVSANQCKLEKDCLATRWKVPAKPRFKWCKNFFTCQLLTHLAAAQWKVPGRPGFRYCKNVCLLTYVNCNLPGCSVKSVLTCQPLQILWLYCEKYLAERIISCISENILYIYLTVGKKCLAGRVIHDLITRKMWLLEDDIFENPSLSIQTHQINKDQFWLFCCNICCFDAFYAVLLQCVLPNNNSCGFVAIYAVLSWRRD